MGISVELPVGVETIRANRASKLNIILNEAVAGFPIKVFDKSHADASDPFAIGLRGNDDQRFSMAAEAEAPAETGTDLKTVIAETRLVRPDLTFQETWDLVKRNRPELFRVDAAGSYEREELVTAQKPTTGKRSDFKTITCSVMRQNPGWSFQQSWNYAESMGLFKVKAQSYAEAVQKEKGQARMARR